MPINAISLSDIFGNLLPIVFLWLVWNVDIAVKNIAPLDIRVINKEIIIPIGKGFLK